MLREAGVSKRLSCGCVVDGYVLGSCERHRVEVNAARFGPGERVRCPGRKQYRSQGNVGCREPIFPPSQRTIVTLRLLKEGWPEPGEIAWVCPRCGTAFAISSESVKTVA